ncbi:MAG TPA: DUF624 domain-containing protein [Lachnospiraceae bacterium]|nr:DUF624 domain-containing protein [Lachnospiraceae bacterium]
MASEFFNPDNKVMSILSRIGDIMLISICFTIASLPVFTLGASASAGYRDMMKVVDESQTYTLKGFFTAFKENFKKGTLLWLIFLAIGLILTGDLYFSWQSSSGILNAAKYIFIILAAYYVMTIIYLFPINATFENTIKNTIKNSALMAIRHLPWTFLLMVIWTLPAILCIFIANLWVYLALIMPVFGFGLQFFASAYIFNHIFRKFYIPKEEPPEDSPEI